MDEAVAVLGGEALLGAGLPGVCAALVARRGRRRGRADVGAGIVDEAVALLGGEALLGAGLLGIIDTGGTGPGRHAPFRLAAGGADELFALNLVQIALRAQGHRRVGTLAPGIVSAASWGRVGHAGIASFVAGRL